MQLGHCKLQAFTSENLRRQARKFALDMRYLATTHREQACRCDQFANGDTQKRNPLKLRLCTYEMDTLPTNSG
jgi:hypothetical protein